MKLHIENIAKIKKADIDINGITVIAGKNNTGKSTVGKLLYSLFETFYNYEDRLYKQKFSAIQERIEKNNFSIPDMKNNVNAFQTMQYRKEYIKNIIHELIDNYNDKMSNDQYITFLKELFEVYGVSLDSFEDFANQILSIVSIDKQSEIDKLLTLSLSTEFNGEFLPVDNKDNVHVELEIKGGNISFDIVDSQRLINVKKYRVLNNEIIYYDNPFIIDRLSKNDKNFFIRFLMHNDDNGTILKHSDKMEQILERQSNIDELNVYNQILSDKVLLKIEQNILNTINGEFVQEDDNFKFKEKNLDVSIELSNLSAGVKSFAILLKLIKEFKIVKNCTLILDEPEIHLHPEWQLRYAELLVLLQKTFDLHILINSHSPYFINAIEVYSAKYKRTNVCKYYLADLDENYKAYFEDVTKDTGKIYDILAKPFDELDAVFYEDEE